MISYKFRYFAIIIILIIIACNKEDFQFGTALADLNGISWEMENLKITADYGVSSVKPKSTLTLTSNKGTLGDLVDNVEYLTFCYLNLNSLEKQKIGFHPVGMNRDSINFLYAQYLIAEYDLGIKSYDVLEMEGWENWLQLDEIKKDKIKGRFQVALKVARGKTNTEYLGRPDTLFFTDGIFEAVYDN